MLESQDLKEITTVVSGAIGGLEQRIDERFKQSEQRIDERFKQSEQRIDERLDEFAGIMNRSIVEAEHRLGVRLDGVEHRIDKLYSLVDGFVSLHQKLDQELTMLRARMDRMEQEFKSLQSQAIH